MSSGWWALGTELGDLLVDVGLADTEQPGDGGDDVARSGQQVSGTGDVLGGHG